MILKSSSLIAGLTAVALSLAGLSAAALPQRLHIPGGVAVVGAPPNATLAIRGTSTLDVTSTLATAVAPCTSTELISLTYTGPVVAQTWTDASLWNRGSASVARTFRKNELSGNTALVTADTASASDATSASLWTVSCSGATYTIG